MSRPIGRSDSSSTGRAPLFALLFMVAPLLVAGGAEAQAEMQIVAFDEGHPDSRATRPFWFEAIGQDGRNPTLRIEPGQALVVHLQNAGTVNHSLVFEDPAIAPTPVLSPNGTATFQLRIPDEATGWTTYGCAFHEVIGMGGVLTFTGEDPEPRRFTMDRDDLVPFPPKLLTEFATIGGQLLPAVLTVALALWVARRRR